MAGSRLQFEKPLSVRNFLAAVDRDGRPRDRQRVPLRWIRHARARRVADDRKSNQTTVVTQVAMRPPREAFSPVKAARGADGNHTRARWVDMHGPIGSQHAGLVVMGAMRNFRAPQTVRLHPNKPYFCFAPMALGEFKLEFRHAVLLTISLRFARWTGGRHGIGTTVAGFRASSESHCQITNPAGQTDEVPSQPCCIVRVVCRDALPRCRQAERALHRDPMI